MDKVLSAFGRFANNFFQMWRVAVPAYATTSAPWVLYHDGHCGGDEECGTTDKEEDGDEECCGGGGCGGDDCGCDK